ncbi:hypothetical protein MBOL_22290 [Mycobacteroides abscessus subsp. bolletii BD]|nr:hypothetical protein MBOL_22290 [Mycobacteroides abscessus subsp. bolletii BD]
MIDSALSGVTITGAGGSSEVVTGGALDLGLAMAASAPLSAAADVSVAPTGIGLMPPLCVPQLTASIAARPSHPAANT